MTTWFIADPHFGEQPKGRQRAAALSADELDALIEQRWCERIAADDVVWHLGDVGDWRRLARLPGVKHLIFGNNDKGRRQTADSGVFASTAGLHRFKADTGIFFLIHDPAHADKAETAPVIHGHLHSLPSPAPGFVSVSVDRHGWSPVRVEEIAPLLRQGN